VSGRREPSKLKPLQGYADRDREPANSTTQAHDPCLAMGTYGPRAPEEAKGAASDFANDLLD